MWQALGGLLTSAGGQGLMSGAGSSQGLGGLLSGEKGQMGLQKMMQGQKGKGPSPRHAIGESYMKGMEDYATMQNLLNVQNSMGGGVKPNRQITPYQMNSYITGLLGV